MIKYIMLVFTITVGLSSCIFTGNSKTNSSNNKRSKATFSNQLKNESSPYLLQHAYNPVNWYPWGEAALQRAKRENKMLIVSIGYSACHWCHVMERESFEDTSVARLMNEYFISIKVDREERPDIDDIYMTSCHLASGQSCGWPLNALALPDGRPFWAGTYFAKKDWIRILNYFIKMRAEDADKLEGFADKLTQGIQLNENIQPIEEEIVFEREKLNQLFPYFDRAIDYQKGGRIADVKFPMPSNWQYLLEYHHLTKNEKALEAVVTTLDNMARGGIYDQLGGGFARYSTDVDWKVPHFEKMLYDNAQLVSLYSFAYQVTKNPRYKEVVYQTLDFVSREMTSPEGGFYSSIDADSDGEEGKYYVWTYDEIKSILTNEPQFEIFKAYYNITQFGNWEFGKNILYATKSVDAVAKQFNTSTANINRTLSSAREKLLLARNTRTRPGVDDKILTSWNALMLKAYADAARVFNEDRFLNIAINNARFLLKEAKNKDYRLTRNYKDGKAVINGFLDDYALLANSLVSVYQASFDEKWLFEAKGLTDYAVDHFYDDETGLFFYTSDLDPPLITRKKEIGDNVIPSSNSVMARNLEMLGAFFFDEFYLGKSQRMMMAVKQQVIQSDQPYFYANWLRHYISLAKPPYEIAIVGNDYERIKSEIDDHYLPNALLLGGAKEGSLLLLEDKLIEGETIIYVCKDKMCKSPVTSVAAALKLME